MAAGNANGAAMAALQNRTVQIAIGVVLLIIILAVAILFFVNAGKNLGAYRQLVSGLDQGRALEIAAQLKSAGIEANIVANETGGSAVEVREKQYDAAVLEIAKSDLLVTDDFKLFDKTDWAASDYEKRVKYMRAVGGETSRLLSRMEGIRWAKVHVTIPPEKVFASRYEKDKTSASVIVEMEPGRILSNNQVASILSLVSGYVPELDPSRISIIDSKGRVYSSATNSDENGNFIGGGNVASSVNSEIERRIQAYLDGVTGIGKSRVAVSTQVINEKVTRNKTTFFSGAIGTHEYSEEALGDAASSQPYIGEAFPAPAPKPVEDIYHQSNASEMVDNRLKKDLPPNAMASSNTNTASATNTKTYNVNNLPPPPDNSRYVCAANDEVCKRNYRRHNFAIHSYPSYEQVMTESPAGTISKVKASVVVQKDSLPVGINELKQGIAAAGYPGMSPDDVQVILSNPPPVKEEPPPKNKVSLFGNKEEGKSFPWLTWLLIVGGFIVLLWLLGRIAALFTRKPPPIKEPPFRSPATPSPLDPRQGDNFNYPPPPRREPPPEETPPPRAANNNDDDLPFDLEDEFALENNNASRPPNTQTPQQPQIKPQKRRPRMVIEDDAT